MLRAQHWRCMQYNKFGEQLEGGCNISLTRFTVHWEDVYMYASHIITAVLTYAVGHSLSDVEGSSTAGQKGHPQNIYFEYGRRRIYTKYMCVAFLFLTCAHIFVNVTTKDVPSAVQWALEYHFGWHLNSPTETFFLFLFTLSKPDRICSVIRVSCAMILLRWPWPSIAKL